MRIKTEHKVLVLSLIGAVLIWLADSLLHHDPSSGFSIWSVSLRHIPPAEFYSRVVFFVSFIVFGLFMSRYVKRLRKAEEQKETFISAVSNSDNGIALTDSSDRYVYVNDAYAELYGYQTREMTGKTCLDLVPPDMVVKSRQVLTDILHNRGAGAFNGEMIALRKDGTTTPIEIRAKAFWDDAGEYLGHTCIVHDISEEKKAKETIEQSARFLNTIFDSIRDPFMILDRDYNIIKANQAYSDLKRIALSELIREKCYQVTRGRNAVCDDCIVAKTLKSGDPSAKEKKITTHLGTEEWIEIYTYPIHDDKGEVSHVIEYVRNITDRKRVEEQNQRFIKELETLSSEDSLTGLLNRRMLFDRMRHEIERVRRYQAELSLIFCDLDSFKEINDTYGHQAGDDVLRAIADILKKSLRTSDIIGRYGGDEFLVVLPQTALKGAQDLAERIRASVEDMKFRMPDGKDVGTTMSIGVTFYDGRETDIDELLNRIDSALYASKKSGKNQVYSLS